MLLQTHPQVDLHENKPEPPTMSTKSGLLAKLQQPFDLLPKSDTFNKEATRNLQLQKRLKHWRDGSSPTSPIVWKQIPSLSFPLGSILKEQVCHLWSSSTPEQPHSSRLLDPVYLKIQQ